MGLALGREFSNHKVLRRSVLFDAAMSFTGLYPKEKSSSLRDKVCIQENRGLGKDIVTYSYHRIPQGN